MARATKKQHPICSMVFLQDKWNRIHVAGTFLSNYIFHFVAAKRWIGTEDESYSTGGVTRCGKRASYEGGDDPVLLAIGSTRSCPRDPDVWGLKKSTSKRGSFFFCGCC